MVMPQRGRAMLPELMAARQFAARWRCCEPASCCVGAACWNLGRLARILGRSQPQPVGPNICHCIMCRVRVCVGGWSTRLSCLRTTGESKPSQSPCARQNLTMSIETPHTLDKSDRVPQSHFVRVQKHPKPGQLCPPNLRTDCNKLRLCMPRQLLLQSPTKATNPRRQPLGGHRGLRPVL